MPNRENKKNHRGSGNDDRQRRSGRGVVGVSE